MIEPEERDDAVEDGEKEEEVVCLEGDDDGDKDAESDDAGGEGGGD